MPLTFQAHNTAPDTLCKVDAGGQLLVVWIQSRLCLLDQHSRLPPVLDAAEPWRTRCQPAQHPCALDERVHPVPVRIRIYADPSTARLVRLAHDLHVQAQKALRETGVA